MRARDLEDPEPPARRQNPAELGQASYEIVEVANPEADRDGIERAVREGKLERVSRDPFDRVRLLAGTLEHALGEIDACHPAPQFRVGDRQVPGTAARVED